MKTELAQLIKEAKCARVELGDDQWGEPDHFAKDSDFVVGLDPKIYSFDQPMLPESVIEQMDNDGYRPGTIADMLTYAINNEEWLRVELSKNHNELIALGTISPVGGGSGTVPRMCWVFEKFYLGTTGFGGHSQIMAKHPRNTVYIAVRK